MQVININVRGAIGFKKGLGVDEIELDLTDKSGLIALAGPNGMGKTTLLELMSPYRTFASRDGKLANHFFLKDSFIKRTFLFNGNKYRTEIKIDSETGNTEGFIYVNDSTKSETTGKNKEYDAYIFDLFGSKALFYNSVFCAQNSKNISDMKTGEIKELFVEFLQIEKLALYEKECKKAIGFFEQKKEVHENQLSGIVKEIEKATGYESELKILQDEKLQIETNISDSEKTIADLRDKLEKKKEIQTQNKINTEKKKDLDIQSSNITLGISGIKGSVSGEKEMHNTLINSLKLKIDGLGFIVSEKDSILSASKNLKTDQERLTDLNKTLNSEKTTLQELKEKQTGLKSGLEKISHKIELHEQDPELQRIKQEGIDTANEIISHSKEVDKINSDINSVSNDPKLIMLKSESENLNKNISLSVNPDCVLDCPAKDIVQDSIKKLPGVKSSILEIEKTLSEKLETLNSSFKHFTKKKDDAKLKREKLLNDYVLANNEIKKSISFLKESYSKTDQEWRDNKAAIVKKGSETETLPLAISSCESSIKYNQALAEKLPDLKVAESKTEDIKKQIQEKTSEFEIKIKELNEKKELKELELKKLNDKVSEIGKSIVPYNDDLIEIYNKKISDDGNSLEITRKSISIIDRNIAVFENDLKKKEEFIKKQDNQRRIISALTSEITEWTYLKLSCSKTGLQALEIDGASPLITREANKLLELSFGLDFQIKIVTQDPETGREVFEVHVIRGDGSEDNFDLLSGGQQIWIAKALTLGMSLVSKQKSGKDFRSLFIDESDGALDKEKAVNFINLYRSIMQQGSFDSCFYISHNSELVDMADYKIDFSGKELRVI